MLILVLLGMYFDAVVIEVKKNLPIFIQIGSGHTVNMKTDRTKLFRAYLIGKVYLFTK